MSPQESLRGASPAAERHAADHNARHRIRTSIDESLIVEASAGTGKTTELVKRIVAVLKSGVKIDRIAAVTFTHKAAGEMKLRLREELDKERHGAPALEDALARLEEASIGTIHSFCAQILRERPVEARVDPAFEEMNEQQSGRVYQRAFRSWLEQRLNESSPGLKRAFARLAWRDSWDDTPPIEQLQWAGRKLIEWRDYEAQWHRQPFARDEEIDTIVRQVMELGAMSARPRRVSDNLYRGLAPVRSLADWIESSERAGPRDYDALESLLLKLGRDLRDSRKGSGAYGEGASREDLLRRRDDLQRWILEFRHRADADLAVLLRQEMTSLVEEYEERKRRSGCLDFVDLLIKVRDLVRDDPNVREYLQNRFERLFVDEFQDTDPLQAETLLLLAADDPAENDWLKAKPKAGKLFLVGDPKQSIYKFRRADIVLYRQVRDALIASGVGFVSLTRSFRSVPGIQQLVNAAFAPEMNGDLESGQAEWAPLEQDRPELHDRPSVVVIPVPRPYKSRISKEAINRSLPDAIAAFIAWLVEEKNGWGFKARDVAILLRRRTQGGTDLTREYARALEARNIPHLMGASRSFHHREEVETLRAALSAVEWPDDELSVFATLKGSLFAIPDDLLLRYRHKHRHLHPFHKHDDDEAAFAPIRDALAVLGNLHRARNYRPFAATVNELIEAARAHAGFVLRPGGQQILANVSRVADLARSYEVSGGISFRGFVEELAAQAEKEDAAEAPVMEQDSDGVRLMTVHGAKGLEFRVVILADLTTNLAAREPDQHVDGKNRLCAIRLLHCAPQELLNHEPQESARERAEGIRVAYVAATRAQDLLVIPAVGDEAFEGWLSPLNKAIYPSRANWRRSQPAPGCPEFGTRSVLERPLDYDREEEFSVRPGLVQPEHGEHSVVWWDPSKLELDVQDDLGLSQDRLLQVDGGSLDAYRAWQFDRNALLTEASEPRFDVFLASHATEDPATELAEPIEVDFEMVPRAKGRPAGRRFGILVHAILRDAELDAGREAIGKLAAVVARQLGSPAKEIEAACQAAERALAHPLMKRARAAERCHREYPVTLPLEDGRLLEGVLDLAFLEDGAWVILDFKTDADFAERRLHYEQQLRWYGYALTKLTGLPARAVLLGV